MVLAIVGASALNAFRSDALTIDGWAHRFGLQVFAIVGALVILEAAGAYATDWIVRTARRIRKKK